MEAAARMIDTAWSAVRDDEAEDDVEYEDYIPDCGDIVWASAHGGQAWPGEVAVNEDKGTFQRKGKVWVQFYHASDGAWCKLQNVVPFHKDTVDEFLEEAEDSDEYDLVQEAAARAYKAMKKRSRSRSKIKRSARREDSEDDGPGGSETTKSEEESSSPTSVATEPKKRGQERGRRKSKSTAKKQEDALPPSVPDEATTKLLAQSYSEENNGSRFSDRDEARLMTLTHQLAQKKRDMEHNLSKIVDALHAKLCALEEEKMSIKNDTDMFLAQSGLVHKMFTERASRLRDDQREIMQKYMEDYEKLTKSMTTLLFENDHTRISAEEWKAKENAVQNTEEVRTKFKEEVLPLKTEYKGLRFKFQDFADFDSSDPTVPVGPKEKRM
eukprot:Plantae.Rhodophyta-Rhodochaete_pulchella.ctg43126.p2 GENE.Plantae.Rhodophyta-Rhodochaete_pulchella.ctg43126~~Plantae.Rhodophyta-Rhodochaete_pulchella.ctg43126.p2  ORF type:complete len:383 (-),score=96.32 Plantae.Rhodophyta-Rhodochaete_pulchella.ctg43126:1434-2582(-)